MKLFLIILRSSWVAVLISAVLGAVSGIANVGLITLIHRALQSDGTEPSNLGWWFVGACVAVLITQTTAKCMLVRLSQATSARVRFELCNKILSSPLPTLESVGSERLLGTLINDVNAITAALTPFPEVCAKTMVLICGLGYLSSMSLPLAAGTILIASIGVASFLTGMRLANRHLKGAREGQDNVIEQLQSMIHGIKELKGNQTRCLEFVYDVLLPAEAEMRSRLIKGMSIQGFAHSWGRVCLFAGIGCLIFLWPRIASVPTSTLTGYTLTILYLTLQLDGILGWLPALNRASISVEKIEAIGLLIDQPESNTTSLTQPKFATLQLNEVTYCYQSHGNDGFELGPIDLSLNKGEILFIAGGNGSGKTTLAKILTGLYAPSEGQIVWNGMQVDDGTRAEYRQLFSTVFVEGHLFDRLLGVDLRSPQLKRWVSLLGIQEKVNLETGRLLTDRLSRGQHKRLALLVAALVDRPIFVFDEWAAEQDPGFKDVFYRRILPELSHANRTVIAITHDDRYFSAADRIVKLIDGQLIDVDKTGDDPASKRAAA